jgi:sugar lactone lactonase YvrE
MKQITTTLMFSLLVAWSVATNAAPLGYSINSDSPSTDADSLYVIDLATGTTTRLGRVQSQGITRLDVEGLAFAPDGTLYGIDDASMTLFPISTDNGVVVNQQEVNLKGLPIGGGNDFGMTFGCDGDLYVTSVATNSLYRVGLDGNSTKIGELGANISALAAYGNPVQLYGLSNGITSTQASESRLLFNIDLETGAASSANRSLGSDVESYNEAGLAFDNDGQLWAITDRRAVVEGSFSSQILRIDHETGEATPQATTTLEQGFESLAVTVPRGCGGQTGSEDAHFVVQKRFFDGNNISPVSLNINCTRGLPISQTISIPPNLGGLGEFEVTFTVESFSDGDLNCTITEDGVEGYTPSYTCLGESDCQAMQSPDSCVFTDVNFGTENLCVIQNYPDPVQLTINKLWQFETDANNIADTADIELRCLNVFDGDGEFDGDDMTWDWSIQGDSSQTVTIYPDFSGGTSCSATEAPLFTAVEAQNGCAGPIQIDIADEDKSCDIVNTVFFEGIPTLNNVGLVLFAFLMLTLGSLAIRRQ